MLGMQYGSIWQREVFCIANVTRTDSEKSNFTLEGFLQKTNTTEALMYDWLLHASTRSFFFRIFYIKIFQILDSFQ